MMWVPASSYTVLPFPNLHLSVGATAASHTPSELAVRSQILWIQKRQQTIKVPPVRTAIVLKRGAGGGGFTRESSFSKVMRIFPHFLGGCEVSHTYLRCYNPVPSSPSTLLAQPPNLGGLLRRCEEKGLLQCMPLWDCYRPKDCLQSKGLVQFLFLIRSKISFLK